VRPSLVKAIEGLFEVAGNKAKRTESMAFSTQIDSIFATLHIHWRDQGQYNMKKAYSYVLDSPDDMIRFIRHNRNIIDLMQRLAMIRTLLREFYKIKMGIPLD
jgi:hypothetical protein